MMKLIIKNADTGEELINTRLAKLGNIFDLKVILNQEELLQKLGLAGNLIADTGINSYCTRGTVMSNDPSYLKDPEAELKKGSIQIGHGLKIRPAEPVKIYNDGEEVETSLRLCFTAYPEGYLLNTGKTSYNIFGSPRRMYLQSIGKRNIRNASADTAHRFSTLDALRKYVLKHKTTLEFTVEKHGYCYGVDYICDLFKADIFSDAKKAEKEKKKIEEVQELLSSINAVAEKEPEPDVPLQGKATPEEMKEEAVSRMGKLRIMKKPVISSFKEEDVLYMSEAGGILYYLNEKAKAAVEEVKSHGLLPYAVIRGHYVFGEVYTVLYVGPDKEKWAFERPDREGILDAYAYNADAPECSEYGPVLISPANGGLVRVG